MNIIIIIDNNRALTNHHHNVGTLSLLVYTQPYNTPKNTHHGKMNHFPSLTPSSHTLSFLTLYLPNASNALHCVYHRQLPHSPVTSIKWKTSTNPICCMTNLISINVIFIIPVVFVFTILSIVIVKATCDDCYDVVLTGG